MFDFFTFAKNFVISSQKQKAKLNKMENKTIRRTLYKVLRKTGVPRNDIELDASFNDDLQFDQVDWALFLFYLEDSFKINVEEKEISQMYQVKDTLNLMKSIA